MIFYVLFVFSVFVSDTCRIEGATAAAYEPTDVLLLNCGATSNTNDTDNRTWWDEEYYEDILSWNTGNQSFAAKAYFAGSHVPFMEARIFRSNFTYKFTVSPGWKFLRLYFYPTLYGSDFNANGSYFSVRVNGFTILKNFSAYLTVTTSKPESKYLIKEFIVPVFETLSLSFIPSSNSLAFVNGVEIVSMPDGFYTKGGFDGQITNVSSNIKNVDEATALETLYRLNVGGHMVSAVKDTGMFRRWLPDDDFLLSENSATKQILPDVKIDYTDTTPAYVAPEDVYNTYRTMGNSQNLRLNLRFNLTWLFKVDAGFTYLVRLHFCDTLQGVNEPDRRIFTIFIGNQIAKLEMSIVSHSRTASHAPIYLDFSVYVGSENGLRPDLRLDLHPPKKFPSIFNDAILNGLEILKLNNLDTIAELNVANTSRRKRIVTITLIAAGSVALAVSAIVFLIFLVRQIKRKNMNNRQNKSVAMFKVLLKHYTHAEVKKITKSFSHTIGKGGFGTVYGGNLCNGRKVAVKVLKDSMGNGEDFINEVASMSQTSHVNIVSLLGFCYEGSKRAIVYEFLENGSLDRFISRENKPLTLDVTTLYGIALGVARGLEYLHYGCKTRIVHFDIKPQNILLDGNLCPKVSDFGLAKLCETRESIVSLIDTRGTIGYIAPEVFSRMYGGVSHKSDVYSYGMLVLEMLGARSKKIVDTTIDSNATSAYFPDWIYEDLENGQQTWILGDEITTEENEIVRKMILVSLWCIQPCPMDRPPMNRVVEMIEGSLDALEIPPKPSMHISRGLVPDQSSSLPSFSHGYEAEENNSNL
ncbi:probable receptor-like protein kinase At5g39030 [Raphanus sativus]|uniref:Probable receptor-like protein kinase At5g39030 n=1 Tax=Raphanus sativus TaxID=3726 RepID=A0A6J0N948_RAPSA|nr:probable receptor-like protein kinase At5g39030 [Raphanus sativus]